MDEKQLAKAMQLISFAGDSKSSSIRAMKAAEDGDFAAAEELLKQAHDSLHQAHNIQTAWMSAEMGGEEVEKSLLLIHSQDHFMAADIMMTVAEKQLNLQKEVKALQEKLD